MPWTSTNVCRTLGFVHLGFLCGFLAVHRFSWPSHFLHIPVLGVTTSCGWNGRDWDSGCVVPRACNKTSCLRGKRDGKTVPETLRTWVVMSWHELTGVDMSWHELTWDIERDTSPDCSAQALKADLPRHLLPALGGHQSHHRINRHRYHHRANQHSPRAQHRPNSWCLRHQRLMVPILFSLTCLVLYLFHVDSFDRKEKTFLESRTCSLPCRTFYPSLPKIRSGLLEIQRAKSGKEDPAVVSSASVKSESVNVAKVSIISTCPKEFLPHCCNSNCFCEKGAYSRHLKTVKHTCYKATCKSTQQGS